MRGQKGSREKEHSCGMDARPGMCSHLDVSDLAQPPNKQDGLLGHAGGDLISTEI